MKNTKNFGLKLGILGNQFKKSLTYPLVVFPSVEAL